MASTVLTLPTVPIEADPAADETDGDSTFSDATSRSASLSSSILKYREENGRTYHSYREGKYAIPNDDIENDRLDLQHALFTLTLDGKLHLAPVKNVRRCLDVGTGTGIWAIDFADEHPEADILAIDLSPIQPSIVPPNVKFLIDDAEDEWLYTERFDFIHARMMMGSFADWPRFLRNCYEHTTPGTGWVELQDGYDVLCDDGTVPDDCGIRRYLEVVGDAYRRMGREFFVARDHKKNMIDAGFVDVHEVILKWPINTWPKDKKLKQLGLWNRENQLQGVEGVALAPLTRLLGWSAEEVQVLAAGARADILNTRMHGYWTIYFVYGRRPAEDEKPGTSA